jgi:hypothetical protein
MPLAQDLELKFTDHPFSRITNEPEELFQLFERPNDMAIAPSELTGLESERNALDHELLQDPLFRPTPHINMRNLIVLLAAINMSSAATFAADKQKSNEQMVRDYVAAFNGRDVDAMVSMVTENIQWLTVAGDKLTIETDGKPKLRQNMAAYFKSNPSAKSELVWVQVTKLRVAALEKASWQGKSGPKSQSSLSVYEFRDGLIARVYYYPAEK